MASLAETLRQAGYVTPQGVTGPNAPLAQQLKNYATNVIPTARQNLAQQRADIDAALTMGQGGVQIGDREAFARQMAEVPNLMGLTAYHGTPHKIVGKFDINKVGTGEGAQAYGHGMYFAESPSVAQTYANTTPAMGAYPTMRRSIHGVEVEAGTPEAHAATLLSRQGMTVKKAKDLVNSWINDPSAMSADQNVLQGWKKTLDTLNTINKKSDVKDIGMGNLYKVDIPDEYIPKMINWDTPFAEQPENLRNLFAKVNPIAVLQKDPTNEFTRWLRLKDTAQKLQNLGYKGIQYKDAASRGTGSGTSNFVVFDPSSVQILEENAKPIARKELIKQEIEKLEK